MTDPAPRRPAPRRRPRLGARAAALASVIAALAPLMSLLSSGWFVAAGAAAAAVAIAGAIGSFGGRWVGAVSQLAAAFLAAWWAFPGPTLGAVVAAATRQLVDGVAPVAVEPPLRFLLVTATALTMVAVNALVAARLPVLAVLPLALILVLPQLAVPRGDHVAEAVLFAACALLMVQAGSATPGRGIGPRVVAASTVAVAVAAGATLGPALPVVPAADAGLFARGTSVDVDLDLGDDLRSAAGTEILRVRTDAASAPYLRLATHGAFAGGAWERSSTEIGPLEDGLAAPVVSGAAGDVPVAEESTWVSDVTLENGYLPLPAGVVAVTGQSAGAWAARDDRTATSGRPAAGETYRAVAQTPDPTRAQLDDSPWLRDASEGLRTRDAAGISVAEAEAAAAFATVDDDVVEGPIGAAAREVAGSARTPYAALLALQDWLRSDAFTYSLSTPVDEGFDGSDADAIARFLEVREGYCVHFASAFALMARAEGIPTRVAVGYLPGTPTGGRVDGLSVFSVDSGQLHAWPEAYLVGVGWVAFDPTPGVATAQGVVAAEASAAPSAAPEAAPSAEAEPEAAQTPTPPAAAPAEDAKDDAAGGQAPREAPWALVALLAAALVAAAPAIARRALAARRRAAARGGDARAAWSEALAAAVDAGIPVAPADTPRRVAARLAEAGAPPSDADALAAALEATVFARDPAPSGDLSGPLDAVTRGIRPTSAPARAAAAILPRSLVRPPRLGTIAHRG
ncbi:transglutaminase domain-containing protein [Microbacterium sp. ZXX196]|uniref:transglutaminase family protein n=1 Tax=Microbacterium sp. ZXX196 TaxID=2609291 RepID=UPI0012B9A9E1|nr:transglutaminase domain-containing protein [Microbacterium sp. ZXX196]MTE24532.1 DUF4129 domain-containing protein [Microbacterium sp. ZXX196]